MKNLFITLSLCFGIVSCHNNEQSPEQKYEEQKISLEIQESSNPLQFLSTDGTYRETLLGNKEVIEGTITNTASIVSFNSIDVEVSFLDENKEVLGTDHIGVSEIVGPNQTITFKEKVKAPEGTVSLGWEIASAQSASSPSASDSVAVPSPQ